MTELLFVRHGQSIGNDLRRFLGHTDLDLTPLGYEQARRTARSLRTGGADAIYTSDLIRARHTADAIAAELGLEPIPDVGLREIFAGEWEGATFDELKSRFGDSYSRFRRDIGNACPDGGESTAAVRERIFRSVDRIVRENEGKRLIIVTHATAICMFACAVLNIAPDDCCHMGLPANATVSTFCYDEGRYVLLTYGDAGHLGDARTRRPPLN